MKKFIIIAAVCLFAGCSSSDTKKVDDTKLNNNAGVSNVNGNIPDTTNAVNLNTRKKDSVGMHTDSSK